MQELQPPEKFDFPFPPYSIQHEFMEALYATLEGRKLGIFESPTGTGKSLSIICGAIRWLKDHNENERNSIKARIEELEAKKRELASTSEDWLTSQSKEIEVGREIIALKLEAVKIGDYDKKIEEIRSKKGKLSSKKKWMRIMAKKNEAPADDVSEEKKTQDEDILLEEGDTKDQSEESDTEDEQNKYKPTKIFICSRTHSQLAQFVGEIRKSPFAEDIRVASLASRQNYCINPSVSRLKSHALINERCLDMQKSKAKQKTDTDGKVVKKQKGLKECKCPYYKQSTIEELKNMVLTEVQDVEDLVTSGKLLNACPYYSSRMAVEDAEVVLVPYNVVLHKATRKANGVDLKGNVLIVDEAHNLLEAMAQMHNCELSFPQISEALRQVKCYKQRFNTRFSAPNLLCINQLIFIMTKLQQLLAEKENKSNACTVQNFVSTAQIDNYNMMKITKFCKDSRIAQKVRTYAIKYPLDKEVVEKVPKKGVKDFLASIENRKGGAKDDSDVQKEEEPQEERKTFLSNPLLAVISFLEALTCTYDDGRIFIHSTCEDKAQRKLQFLLLNPSSYFEDIVKDARAIIVAGGTMKPSTEFRNRLFINSGAPMSRIVEFSCDHIIPPENILPIIVKKGACNEDLLFNYENRMSMGGSIKSVIQQCCKTIKGGIVVFFPSYSYENWVWQQIKDLSLGREVFREPKDSGSVESVLKKYADAITKPGSPGALLLSVVGGKLSEGLNFSDDLGRCVVVVGLPYANITAPDLKEKMAYLDTHEERGAGKRFYENLCMKAVNQSIGRAVRHKNDFATILLLDERYNRTYVKNALPNWIRRSLKVCDFHETFQHISRFFEERRAQISKD